MAITNNNTGRNNSSVSDDNARLDVDQGNSNINSLDGSKDVDNASNDYVTGRTITEQEIETLSHFQYDSEQDQLIGDRAIETTLNSLFLGEQHKMSSGAENIFFTNLGNNTNFYPMWGGLKDQSLVAN